LGSSDAISLCFNLYRILTRKLHEHEDAEAHFCYERVVETAFEAGRKASACLKIARHSVCRSPDIYAKPAVLPFDQTNGSSDGGAILLKAADRRSRLVEALAGCLRAKRQAGKVDHSLPELLAQRVFSIACVYGARSRCRPGLRPVDIAKAFLFVCAWFTELPHSEGNHAVPAPTCLCRIPDYFPSEHEQC
jgi:hypothetical protein